MKLARRITITADTLRPREREVLAILAIQPGKARGDYAKLLGVTPNSAGAYLDALQAIGLVHARGFGRGAKWWPGESPPAVVEVARHRVVNSVWSMA